MGWHTFVNSILFLGVETEKPIVTSRLGEVPGDAGAFVVGEDYRFVGELNGGKFEDTF
jgi:hypothetical protein